VLSVRPKVAELSFQVFGRCLHPELFVVYKSRTIERAGYKAQVDITSAGHVVTWQRDGVVLTEVCCSAQHPLPQRRRLLSFRLKGERTDRVECRGGISYEMSYQLEPVTPALFWSFQDQLNRDASPSALMYNFLASGRIAVGAVSLINVEARNRSFVVQGFHTFPDDCAIVKTRAVISLP